MSFCQKTVSSEIRGEPVTDMLTSANQPGPRWGKYQSVCSWNGTCTVSPDRHTRQHRCVKAMTSLTGWKVRDLAPEGLIICDLLFWEIRKLFSDPPVFFRLSPNLSRSQWTFKGKLILPGHVSASSFAGQIPTSRSFWKRALWFTQTLLLLPSWSKEKRKWDCVCPSGLL